MCLCSGKTLAFLVPLLEKLFRLQFSASDGPGALVLSPTRELAVQIFDVLRQVGAYHSLAAGLLVGGRREFHLEQQHVGRTNILIATPGRLLQHLEQTPHFDTSQLQVLVLDEADRILDMGFRQQMNRILDYLPTSPQRQTMLFSATQTKKVSDLAALSLQNPEYLGVHDKEKTSTPESLKQSLVVVPLEHKLNAVYSFVKTHLKHKSIVFMASCSQVRHAWELFCHLQPGLPVMALHGKLVQEKRTKIYTDFCQRPHAVLFATDVAARGLDFPSVDWVVQADAPEDKDMYIHRAGRTARYKANGKAMLMVTPTEEAGFLGLLQKAKIPIQRLSINPNRTVLVTQRAASLVASRPKLHDLAKKAFSSYVRSIHLMPNQEIFSTKNLDLDAYASSLGLSSTPKVKYLRKDRDELRQKKNVNHKLNKLKEQIRAEKLAKRVAKLGQKPAQAKKRSRAQDTDDEDEEDGGLLLVAKDQRPLADAADEPLPEVDIHQVSKSRHAKKIRIDGGTGQNKHTVFDDDGEEESSVVMMKPSSGSVRVQDLSTANEDYMQKVRDRLAKTRSVDRAEAKQRIRDKHRKKRMQDKEKLEDEDEEDGGVLLDTSIDDHQGISSDDGASADSESESEAGEDIKTQEELALALIRNT